MQITWTKIILKSIVFAIFLLVLFWLNRLLFLFYGGVIFNGVNISTRYYDYIQVFSNSLHFDGGVIAILSILYFAIYVIFSKFKQIDKIIFVYSCIIFVISIFLNMANIAFFEMFRDTFDANLLNIMLHNKEIGDIDIYAKIFAAIFLSFVIIRLYYLICLSLDISYSYDPLVNILSKDNRFFVSKNLVLFGILCVILAGFSLLQSSINIDRQSALLQNIKNPFLRLITPGAINDIHILYLEYKNATGKKFSDYYDGKLLPSSQEYFSLASTQTYINLESLLTKKVKSDISNLEPPKNPREKRRFDKIHKDIEHIFYIIIDEVPKNVLVDSMHLDYADKSTINIRTFLQNAKNDSNSLDTHIIGMLQSYMSVNSLMGSIHHQKAATASVFSRLGYVSNFYYTHNRNFLKLYQYADTQGFSNVYYSLDLEKYSQNLHNNDNFQNTKNGILLDMLGNNLQNTTKKSFNMILLENMESNELNAMLDRFIYKISAISPKSLFVITGRNRYDDFVPLIFYSPSQILEQISNVGSSMDILPSILELVAPHNFRYISFGRPLVSLQTFIYPGIHFAFGEDIVATDRFVYDGTNISYIISNTERKSDIALANDLYKRLRITKGLSGYILINGWEINK